MQNTELGIHDIWLRALPVPAVLHDGHRVLSTNQAAARALGVTSDELMRRPLSAIVDAPGPWETVTSDLPSDPPLRLTVFNRSPDGDLRDLLEHAIMEKQAALDASPIPAIELECCFERREGGFQALTHLQVLHVSQAAIAFFKADSGDVLIAHLSGQFQGPEVSIGLAAACTGTEPVRRSFGIEMASVTGDVLRFGMTVSRVTPLSFQPTRLVIYIEDNSRLEASVLNLEAYREQLQNLTKLRCAELGATQRLVASRTRLMESLLASRSPHIAAHMKRVANLVGHLGHRLGLDSYTLAELVLAAEYHDVGVLNIPCEILGRMGPISPAEYALIQEHPMHSCEILSAGGYSESALRVISEHHERFDGSGYPLGIEGEDICLGARILAVADVVDAMTAQRPYRAPMGLSEALGTLSAADRHFDPQIVKACIDVFASGFVLDEEPADDGYVALAEALLVTSETKG